MRETGTQMIKKTLLTIFIAFNVILSAFSIDANLLSDDFRQIIDVDEANRQFISADFDNISYTDYFRYYSLVSEELNRYDDEFSWFIILDKKVGEELMNSFHTTDIEKLGIDRQKEFAEKLLEILHENVFRQYVFNADRLSAVIAGDFNCVSSSIMYSIFLTKYGFSHNPVQTIDHAFIKINFPDGEMIDVETTNMYGFDPGKKKDVLDEFGKTTGFTYVPQKNYADRKDITRKALLLDVYHNLLNYYFSRNDYLKACKLAYIIYLASGNEAGKKDFDTAFNNLIAGYAKNTNYAKGIEDINSYLDFMGKNDFFVNQRFDLMNNMINNWNDVEHYDALNDYLLNENSRYDYLANDPRFIKPYLYFIYKITNLSQGKKYREAFGLLNDFLKKNPGNPDITDFRYKLLNNYVYQWNDYNNFDGMNDYLLGQNELFENLKGSKEFADIYLGFINKEIENLDKNGRYADSYGLVKNYNSRFNNSETRNVFSNILKDEFDSYRNTGDTSIYNTRSAELLNDFPDYADIIGKYKKYYLADRAYSLMKSNNYANAISEYKQVYFENRDDPEVRNNLINLYVNYTTKLYNQNDIKDMIKYCDEALSLFPDNYTLKNNYLSFFINLINNAINNNDIKKAKSLVKTARTKFPDNDTLQSIDRSLQLR